MQIKKEIRIVGWDDAPFEKGSGGKVILIGTIFRGGSSIDGILSTEIEIDGMDATEKISRSVNNCKHKDIRIIMLDGITFGGFNFVDIKKLQENTSLPVISVIRKKTDMRKFTEAMKKLPDFEERWSRVENAGDFYELKMKRGKSIYFQKIGLTEEEARKVIEITLKRSNVPEPIRISHMIASGIIKGESIGRV